MKKLLCKIFSYKVWSYAAAIVTVLMAIPALKECMKKLPTIEVSVGKFWVTDEEKVTLLYVVPNTTIDKYQVPLPLSFINNGETAIHNFLGRLSTELLKIGGNDNKDAYMRRFLNGDEHLDNHIQNIYVKSASMVSKGKIELSTKGYELNFVRRKELQTYFPALDNFNFNLEITFDNQETPQSIIFNAICMTESQYKGMLLTQKKLDRGKTFVIFTETVRLTDQEDGIKIVLCRLKGVAKGLL
mgnify:CR=1 FL=1